MGWSNAYGSRTGNWVVGDRNFDSKTSRELLAGRGIVNAIAPRDVGLLRARQVAWNVLTHNLWLLAGLPKRESRALRKAS